MSGSLQEFITIHFINIFIIIGGDRRRRRRKKGRLFIFNFIPETNPQNQLTPCLPWPGDRIRFTIAALHICLTINSTWTLVGCCWFCPSVRGHPQQIIPCNPREHIYWVAAKVFHKGMNLSTSKSRALVVNCGCWHQLNLLAKDTQR